MSRANGELLIQPGVDWTASRDENGILELGYTFYSATNNIPEYWYVDDDRSKGFSSDYKELAKTSIFGSVAKLYEA